MNNATTTIQANKKKEQRPALPQDPATAVQRLLNLTQTLINMAERETQALLQNDILTFSILQDEKEILAGSYERASQDFRSRLNMFRGIDKALLNRLETAQKELGEKTTHNNGMVERLHITAKQNTQKTLLSVQELGQQRPVRFDAAKTEEKGI